MKADQPIFVAVETLCYDGEAGSNLVFTWMRKPRVLKWIGQEDIRQIQRAVVDRTRSIFPGPNLEFISGSQRWDACHLSRYGLS